MTTIEQIKEVMERTVKNCRYYYENGDMTHYINEVGCLRGIMYIADIIGFSYPQLQIYESYIKVASEYMEKQKVN